MQIQDLLSLQQFIDGSDGSIWPHTPDDLERLRFVNIPLEPMAAERFVRLREVVAFLVSAGVLKLEPTGLAGSVVRTEQGPPSYSGNP